MIRLTVERQGVARLPPTRGGLRIGGFCRHDSAVRHCQQGKGPIRANGKGLVFSRRVGDALSKNFANLRSDSSTLGEETHPRACGTRTISGRECPCGHSLPHRSAQSVLSVRTCRSASGGFRVSSRGGLSASRGGCRVRVVWRKTAGTRRACGVRWHSTTLHARCWRTSTRESHPSRDVEVLVRVFSVVSMQSTPTYEDGVGCVCRAPRIRPCGCPT